MELMSVEENSSKGFGTKNKGLYSISGKSVQDVGKTKCSAPYLVVDRLALTMDGRHKKCFYEVHDPPGITKKIKTCCAKTCSCSARKLKKYFFGKLPILSWIIGYDIKNWLGADVIAGCTVAVMQIPQGMGFALLANIPAVCGIYMAFFQSLVYAFLGTSRHNSMGTFAVITLMTGKVVKELATIPDKTGANVITGMMNPAVDFTESPAILQGPEEGEYTPIQIATLVCFMTGVWHMIFGLLHLGSLTVFLSDMLVSGFTTGAAIHIFTSQMKDLLGISIKEFTGPMKILYTYIEVCKAVPTINIVTLLITFTTISILVLNNESFKPVVSKYSQIPIPIELIAITTGTTISFMVNLSKFFSVDIVGDIPTGFPAPATPPLELWNKVVVDSFAIAVVSYTVNFSLAKIFAAKHDHPVDSTQELYATGVTNLVSCFFSCGPTGSSLARTLIQDTVGGKTQVASFVVCAILTLVLLFIGPVFETLPKAVLASIIIVALKGMFIQIFDVMAMWKVSKIEALIWLVTFFSVVFIEIDIGLLVGVVFSLIVLLVKNQRPTTFTLGRVPNTDVYLDLKNYPQAKEVPGMKLFKIIGPIHFANLETLKTVIIKRTKLDPKKLKNTIKKNTEIQEHKEKIIMETIENGINKLNNIEQKVRILILDLSGVSYIDSSGGKFLNQMRKEYEKAQICFCLAGMQENVYEIMWKSGSLKEFHSKHLFHSIHDAVVILTSTSVDIKNDQCSTQL